MAVRLEFKDDVLTAKFSGDIDHHTAANIRTGLDESLQSLRPMVLKLDFEEVSFMDSSGIGLILGRIRLMKHWGGRVILCNISDEISKMAKIAGIFSFAGQDRRAGR